MDPEDQAKAIIDQKLRAAGWRVQHYRDIDIDAGLGVAVREFPLPGHGEADYLLYADGEVIGVIEAKPVGHTLSGVELQSARYIEGLPENLPAYSRPLPFAYESTSVETRFTNTLEEHARSRPVFHFHKPETLIAYAEAGRDGQLRNSLRTMPPLNPEGLWPAQVQAIGNLERSLAFSRPRALIQMATGSGKTFTAAHAAYRLIKHANARRILFLVDRRNLGRQAENEFKNMVPPDDPRQLQSIYNVNRLTRNTFNPSDKIVIATVQRVFSMLRGDSDDAEVNDEGSMFDTARSSWSNEPIPVEYNPVIPISSFDFIVVDECHRSIYGQWRQVLEYFDAFVIGLTATPAKQTIGFFNQNLVMEYGHTRAVADGVNVNYDVYRVRTRITEQGGTLPAKVYVEKRDKLTRRQRAELLDSDLTYSAHQLDKDVVAADQIRKVIQTYRDRVIPEAFPDRNEAPKTLIFAKDDSHAEDIVRIVREEFGKGNAFCQKITYRTGFLRVPVPGSDPDDPNPSYTWEKVTNLTADEVLTAFRTMYDPRIAVTVDMIATGTDVKPVEALMFLRVVKSANFFEQMKGRGVRVISPDDLMAVTPSARTKDRFIIVDAVGVCEQDKTDSAPLNRQPSRSLQSVLNYIASGGTDEDALSTLASRLVRLDKALSDDVKDDLKPLADGRGLKELAAGLVKAIDPDEQVNAARTDAGLSDDQQPTEEQVQRAAKTLAKEAARPFRKAEFRRRLLDAKQQSEQVIDTITTDELFAEGTGFDEAARERARQMVDDFRAWIEENRDELTAIQIFYNRPFRQRPSFEAIRDIAKRIQRPPMNLTPEKLWHAYKALEGDGRGDGGGKQLTDLVTLIRHAIHPDEPLTPFGDVVIQRYRHWLEEQERAGVYFRGEQREWLDHIAEHIATSVTMEREDFSYGWFAAHGDLGRAHALFGDKLDEVIDSLNRELVA